MTKEELREHCEKQVKMCEEWAKGNDREPSGKIYEEHKLILDLINELQDKSYELWKESYEEEHLRNIRLEEEIKALEQQPSEGIVSMEVYKQVIRERDIAIEQLRELGYDFGEKITPSDDCVSREEVNKLYDEYRPRLATHVSEFGDKLKALPPVTPTQSWIPVSERLPKESDGVVLIMVNGEVNTGRYSEFSNTWYKGDMRGVGGDDPIAWQPLPKPYDEKRGSENASDN